MENINEKAMKAVRTPPDLARQRFQNVVFRTSQGTALPKLLPGSEEEHKRYRTLSPTGT